MKTAQLNGRDHTRFGAVSAVAETRAAIAISRGGAAKPYGHKDPNEDAAAFVESGEAAALVVADGHSGAEGAEAVTTRFAAEHLPRWLSLAPDALRSRWRGEVLDALLDANAVLVDLIARRVSEGARTTVAVAVVRPADDLLAVFSLGDSHIFRLRGGAASELAVAERTGVDFVGSPAEDRESLAAKHAAEVLALGDTSAVVLATDGLSERGIGVDDPAAAVHAAAARAAAASGGLRALAIARGVVETALAAHRRNDAGDNVASAVWVAGPAA